MIFQDDLLFTLIKVVFVTACTLGMMSTLTVFKYSIKKVLTIFGIYLLWVGLSSAAIIYFFGFEGIMRVFFITISMPAIFVAYKMDKDFPTLAVFNYSTQITFSLILIMVAVLINTAIGGDRYTDLLVRAIIYAVVIYLEYKFLRKPFRDLTDLVQTGWGLLSIIPVCFSLLVALVETFPVHYINNPANIFYIFGITVTMLIVYFVVYQSLIRQYHLQILTRDKDILQVQISAMDKQSATVLAAEEKLRILRHDVRHISHVMQAHLQNGAIGKATDVLSALEATIADATTKSYCDDHIVNSMLASFFDRAENKGIKVMVSFTMPPAAKVDSIAFSVMLANALENALYACEQQTTEQPTLELKSRVFNGQYMLELSNTYNENVRFNKDGLPVSSKGDGHGIGTRSIQAFAKAHDATLSFQVENSRFILQIMFSVE